MLCSPGRQHKFSNPLASSGMPRDPALWSALGKPRHSNPADVVRIVVGSTVFKTRRATVTSVHGRCVYALDVQLRREWRTRSRCLLGLHSLKHSLSIYYHTIIGVVINDIVVLLICWVRILSSHPAMVYPVYSLLRETFLRDATMASFPECNPAHFEIILKWLQDRTVTRCWPIMDQQFRNEARFYGVSQAMFGDGCTVKQPYTNPLWLRIFAVQVRKVMISNVAVSYMQVHSTSVGLGICAPK